MKKVGGWVIFLNLGGENRVTQGERGPHFQIWHQHVDVGCEIFSKGWGRRGWSGYHLLNQWIFNNYDDAKFDYDRYFQSSHVGLIRHHD